MVRMVIIVEHDHHVDITDYRHFPAGAVREQCVLGHVVGDCAVGRQSDGESGVRAMECEGQWEGGGHG